MTDPYILIAETGMAVPLRPEVTTVGRSQHVDVRLADPTVSVLHAEIVRRGPYAYVTDLGLSRNGTRVNGRLIGRRLLADGDALAFGSARCRIGGLAGADPADEAESCRAAAPELTRREVDVVTALCRPAMSDAAFVAPATARDIAAELVVTEAAVKQHLLRLYQKFRIPEGQNRRIRLANEVVALGLVRLLLPDEHREPSPVPRPATRPATRPAGQSGRVPPRRPAVPGTAVPGTAVPGTAVPGTAVPGTTGQPGTTGAGTTGLGTTGAGTPRQASVRRVATDRTGGPAPAG
jgi:hypothetical protein